jgi:hypothetical protein
MTWFSAGDDMFPHISLSHKNLCCPAIDLKKMSPADEATAEKAAGVSVEKSR